PKADITPFQCARPILASESSGLKADAYIVGFWSKAHILSCTAHVCFWVLSGHAPLHCKCPFVTQRLSGCSVQRGTSLGRQRRWPSGRHLTRLVWGRLKPPRRLTFMKRP